MMANYKLFNEKFGQRSAPKKSSVVLWLKTFTAYNMNSRIFCILKFKPQKKNTHLYFLNTEFIIFL